VKSDGVCKLLTVCFRIRVPCIALRSGSEGRPQQSDMASLRWTRPCAHGARRSCGALAPRCLGQAVSSWPRRASTHVGPNARSLVLTADAMRAAALHLAGHATDWKLPLRTMAPGTPFAQTASQLAQQCLELVAAVRRTAPTLDGATLAACMTALQAAMYACRTSKNVFALNDGWRRTVGAGVADALAAFSAMDRSPRSNAAAGACAHTDHASVVAATAMFDLLVEMTHPDAGRTLLWTPAHAARFARTLLQGGGSWRGLHPAQLALTIDRLAARAPADEDVARLATVVMSSDALLQASPNDGAGHRPRAALAPLLASPQLLLGLLRACSTLRLRPQPLTQALLQQATATIPTDAWQASRLTTLAHAAVALADASNAASVASAAGGPTAAARADSQVCALLDALALHVAPQLVAYEQLVLRRGGASSSAALGRPDLADSDTDDEGDSKPRAGSRLGADEAPFHWNLRHSVSLLASFAMAGDTQRWQAFLRALLEHIGQLYLHELAMDAGAAGQQARSPSPASVSSEQHAEALERGRRRQQAVLASLHYATLLIEAEGLPDSPAAATALGQVSRSVTSGRGPGPIGAAGQRRLDIAELLPYPLRAAARQAFLDRGAAPAAQPATQGRVLAWIHIQMGTFSRGSVASGGDSGHVDVPGAALTGTGTGTRAAATVPAKGSAALPVASPGTWQALLRKIGSPVPEHQALPSGLVFDIAWPAARVALQVDGPTHFVTTLVPGNTAGTAGAAASAGGHASSSDASEQGGTGAATNESAPLAVQQRSLRTAARDAVARATGWHVGSISVQEWEAAHSDAEKASLLLRRLRANG
jgi:hypothetical protein